jgi:hypothetical protein
MDPYYQQQPYQRPWYSGLTDLFTGNRNSQYPPQGGPYGGEKKNKTMKTGGGSVVPYSENVWTRQGSFPAAVGGRRKKGGKRKTKKGGKFHVHNLTRRRDGGKRKYKK